MQTLQRAPVTIVVTQHAVKRARQRLSLRRSAVVRTAERAWASGAVLDSAERGSGDPSAVMLRWLDHVFVFRGKPDRMMLVSIVPDAPLMEPDEDREQRIKRLGRCGRRRSYRWSR